MKLWARGEIYKRVAGFEPLLAQWEKHTHPAQIRLHEYLDWLTAELTPLPEHSDQLYLHLEVAVKNPEHRIYHHDLENFLTPLFGRRWLNPRRFVLVSARKKVGDASSIEIGLTTEASKANLDTGWEGFTCSPGSGASSKAWKERIRSALAHVHTEPLPSGPVEVQLAWRCSSQRNWVCLWKPTGDSMGPVLGYAATQNPYSPNDDRIVALTLHKEVVADNGYDIDVGMWWRLLASA